MTKTFVADEYAEIAVRMKELQAEKVGEEKQKTQHQVAFVKSLAEHSYPGIFPVDIMIAKPETDAPNVPYILLSMETIQSIQSDDNGYGDRRILTIKDIDMSLGDIVNWAENVQESIIAQNIYAAWTDEELEEYANSISTSHWPISEDYYKDIKVDD